MSDRTMHPAAEPGTDPSIRELDWSATPLGPRDVWPTALTSIHEMMMASPFAMCAGWGASGYSHVLAQNGTDGFELLHKPYSVEQLSRLLRKVATWQRRKRIMATG